jgi:hypothetical protein
MNYGLVVEIGSHVMRDRNNEGSDFRKVALVTTFRLEKRKLDHVAVVAGRRKSPVRHPNASTDRKD